MIIKLQRKKISDIPGHCWYCDSMTCYALYEQDGSEIWCCDKCYVLHGRIVKRSKTPYPTINPTKSNRIFANNEGNLRDFLTISPKSASESSSKQGEEEK